MITIGLVLAALLACVLIGRKYFVSFLGWLYLGRVSVLGLAIFAALPLAARGPGRSLAIGAFDLKLWDGAFAVGLLLPLVAWAIYIAAALVFAYGGKRSRFDLAPPPDWLLVLWRLLLAAVVILNAWTIISATDVEDRSRVGGWLAGGFIVALVLVWIVEEFHRRTHGQWLGGTLYLLPHRGGGVKLREASDRQRAPAVTEPDGPWNWLFCGYREFRPNRGWVWQPGHLLALSINGILVVLNFVIYHVGLNTTGDLTALAYLLVTLLTAVLVFGGAAFFLDAYRLPFISAVIAWLLLMGFEPKSDHVYRIWPREGGVAEESAVLTPAEILRRAGATGRPVVVVAIAGGGIQSAVWGTRVLTGIEEAVLEAQEPGKLGALPDFAGSIQCISGVSGGSTGAMFFVAAYGEGGLAAPRLKQPPVNPEAVRALLPKIVSAASASSLGQSVWGLAYPDLRRAWFPLGIRWLYRDRAEKMELKWAFNAERDMSALGKTLGTASLSEWQRRVAAGEQPAIIFNATIVETGERLSFSTSPARRFFPGQREFVTAGEASDAQLYPGADLRITTAARLSASFPAVSPVARPCVAADRDAVTGSLWPTKEVEKLLVPGAHGLHHVTDGGYYDNTGLGALTHWLDDGLTELSQRDPAAMPRSVLVIQIDGFPVVPVPLSTAPRMQSTLSRGTLSQALAPLAALYNVRGVGHNAAAEGALGMLQQRWKAVPTGGCSIEIARFTIPLLPAASGAERPRWFEAKPDQPPLSWHLREVEKREIERAWNAVRDESVLLPRAGATPAGQRPSRNLAWTESGAWPLDHVLDFLSRSPATSAQ